MAIAILNAASSRHGAKLGQSLKSVHRYAEHQCCLVCFLLQRIGVEDNAARIAIDNFKTELRAVAALRRIEPVEEVGAFNAVELDEVALEVLVYHYRLYTTLPKVVQKFLCLVLRLYVACILLLLGTSVTTLQPQRIVDTVGHGVALFDDTAFGISHTALDEHLGHCATYATVDAIAAVHYGNTVLFNAVESVECALAASHAEECVGMLIGYGFIAVDNAIVGGTLQGCIDSLCLGVEVLLVVHLNLSAKQFQIVLNGMHDGSIVVDTVWRILIATAYAHEFLAFERTKENFCFGYVVTMVDIENLGIRISFVCLPLGYGRRCHSHTSVDVCGGSKVAYVFLEFCFAEDGVYRSKAKTFATQIWRKCMQAVH